jgi:CDK inhibitor PHO81
LSGYIDAKGRFTRTFLAAISEAPTESLQFLLKTGLIDFQAEDEINERNCLHEAAIFGNQAILEIGLSQGVDVARPDVYGRLPLHYASMHGRVRMIQILLQQNSSTINNIDHDNFTPLIHGIVHHHLDAVKEILDYGARIEPEGESDHIPLNLACQYGSTQIIELLLQRKASIISDAEGLYPQHLVARKGVSPDNILLLQRYGADLDQRDKLYQWTPLFHAVSEGNVECAKALLNQDVKVNITDEKGLSPMYYATWEGHLECMKLLIVSDTAYQTAHTKEPSIMVTEAPEPMKIDADGIPDLSLPPPIIPLRRYGHNFLDNKAFVQLSFEVPGSEAIQFYNDSKYPAARLTISSKSSDLIPRNLMLPIQEDSRHVSFQVDNLDAFVIDFDIFPTFGSRIIARSVALPSIFAATNSSSGYCSLPLFDPRLRLIGHINLRFQVIKPFTGIPLEVAQFETYWKATSHLDIYPNTVITGSSLSGEYLQLFVQLTSDCVPILFPRWCINHGGIEIPIGRLSLTQLQYLFGSKEQEVLQYISQDSQDISGMHQALANCPIPLKSVLATLPSHINVGIHILYPDEMEEQRLGLEPKLNINNFADAILTVVFDHARVLRDQKPDLVRSMIFTSYNPDICTALNWKQPNCM